MSGITQYISRSVAFVQFLLSSRLIHIVCLLFSHKNVPFLVSRGCVLEKKFLIIRMKLVTYCICCVLNNAVINH